MQLSRYGPDPGQYGELYLPTGAARPGVVVVIHGGFWRARYDASLGRPLAVDLARRGWAAWNVEYRRVGMAEGGWPGTLDDVAAAIDHLAKLPVDVSRVVAVGHSAGGHLAAWAASGRASPAVPVSGVVTQAGVLDLAAAARQGVGNGAVVELLGGRPDQVPERYAAADPIALVPAPAPFICLHSRTDDSVPFGQSTAYVDAAVRAGASARLVETDGDHMSLVDPSSSDWGAAVDALSELLG